MEIKNHFKMYKSGKQWCVAALATLAITTGGILSTSTAHADTTSVVPSSAVEAVSTNLSANNEAVLVRLLIVKRLMLVHHLHPVQAQAREVQVQKKLQP